MRHPTEGALRRLLDEPAGVPDSERQHVSGCSQCLAELGAVREDADLVDRALSPLSTGGRADVDVDAAWQSLSTGTPVPGTAQAPAPAKAGRFRSVLRRPFVAALAAAVVLTGAGTAAASGWLQIFSTEQIAAVSLSPADLTALPDLSQFGDFEVSGDDSMHQVRNAAAAARQTGLEVPQVSLLPDGVSGRPAHQVVGEVSATLTFSTDRAARAVAETGDTLPRPPPGLDGSRVRLVAGPGLAQVWSQQTGVPVLIVGRAVAPSAFSSGPPFETVRDYLLSLPGLPDDVAAQLRTFTADGSTLPLPVPADQVSTSSTEVNGVPATVLATHDRTMAAVVWVDDGVVTAVAGALAADEVLTVARELR